MVGIDHRYKHCTPEGHMCQAKKPIKLEDKRSV